MKNLIQNFYFYVFQNNQETPTKSGSSTFNKSSIVLRSTPRKRLLLNDPLELSSPDKYKLVCTLIFYSITLYLFFHIYHIYIQCLYLGFSKL